MSNSNFAMKRCFIVCALISFLFSCDSWDDKLVINNKTSDTIVVSVFYRFPDKEELYKNNK